MSTSRPHRGPQSRSSTWIPELFFVVGVAVTILTGAFFFRHDFTACDPTYEFCSTACNPTYKSCVAD